MPADFGPRLPPEGVEGVLVVSLSPSHPLIVLSKHLQTLLEHGVGCEVEPT